MPRNVLRPPNLVRRTPEQSAFHTLLGSKVKGGRGNLVKSFTLLGSEIFTRFNITVIKEKFAGKKQFIANLLYRAY